MRSAIVGLLVVMIFATQASAQVIHRPERRAMHKTNQIRVDHGLRRYEPGPALRRKAERQALSMMRHRSLFHARLFHARTDRCWGQNVGVGPNVRAVIRAFMRSYEHRRNMLSHCYRRFGVGVVRHGGQVWVAINFAG